jgi:hypothetical protein
MQTRRYGDYQADIYLDGPQDIANLRVASAQAFHSGAQASRGPFPFATRAVTSVKWRSR